uniref:FinTRIM family, member 87 n=1 Tax=Myripristis murdjan TaxID=586833 RepID=A0A667YLK8_9TELE
GAARPPAPPLPLDSAKFCCSICLDLLKDPVTIPCGHSYCLSCIKRYWDGEEQREIHRCPQCRQTFTPRPVLGKNTMLAEIVEEMKKTGLQAAPPNLFYAGPGDVACDVCVGRKLKALKSCLVCLVSYCEHHLQPHYDAAPLKKHKLVEATVQFQENICSRSRQKIQQRIQDTEKDVKVLQQEVEAINRSADKAVEDSEKIFTELISLIEKRRSDQQHPSSEAEYLQYSCQITLDPNTANTRLSLSEWNRKATRIGKHQPYCHHPDRFTTWFQVLSREGLTGHCYWEVEWSGPDVSIAVAYKDISRTGQFGSNDKSWALDCYNQFSHNSIKTPTSVPVSSRVAVYLDHRAGILSFYNVSETMTLLHRVQTTFTQPLHAGFRVYGGSAEFCQLK